MCGKELMFMTFKGRIAKDDFSVVISEHTTNWSHEIQKIMLNGCLIYFEMPTFPYPQLNNVKAVINVYFKQEKLHESTYLYMNLFERMYICGYQITHLYFFVSFRRTSRTKFE